MPVKYPLPTGYTAPGFERVLRVYRDNFTKGIEKGSSFAAYYKGKLIVNIWGGLADQQVKRPWKDHTFGFFYSTTKFFAAVTIAHIVERGLLRYDEKIAKYWPDFAKNGKEEITLEMLLSHKAGLPALSNNFELSWMKDDPKKLYDALVDQKPLWNPGDGHGYSPVVFGLYLNEIVKRVDKKGRTLSQYYWEEIGQPFGLDFHIGVPAHLQYRAARLEPVVLTREDLAKMMEAFKLDPTIYALAFSQPTDWNSSRKLNDPDFLQLPNSSSHGGGTAEAVAKLAGILANGGQHDGKTLLSPDSIARLQEPLADGVDRTTGSENIHGRGTWLIPVVEGDQSWFMYGHAGYGDQCCAADPRYKMGWAYTTNYLDPVINFNNKNKWRPLIKELFECVHRLENVQVERRILLSLTQLEQEKSHASQKSQVLQQSKL
ncbi:beta-lactamase domain-containing protein 2-like [Physella acuta]|uniref:beta-lactamase domain-containing protein 2-like n=1 Tax=Physella acuta TaxID=109671 RepID=UPI0027DDBD4B|nr:beta-lactamase domain-containing protein 2-like [Physella acuta]